MIVAFDLDDTLYREMDFVESGFRAVAAELERRFGVPSDLALERMWRSLNEHGRGRQFDDALQAAGLYSVQRRDRLVQVYRRHQPDLRLPEASDEVLTAVANAGHRLFLVTDGNPVVQAAKLDALGLRQRFEHCYLTSRYGLHAAKPSTRVFELMLKRTGSRAEDLVYIGDDPRKDFVGVRKLGGHTIRVLTGNHADELAKDGFGADVDVDRLGEVVGVIEAWSARVPVGADHSGDARPPS